MNKKCSPLEGDFFRQIIVPNPRNILQSLYKEQEYKISVFFAVFMGINYYIVNLSYLIIQTSLFINCNFLYREKKNSNYANRRLMGFYVGV